MATIKWNGWYVPCGCCGCGSSGDGGGGGQGTISPGPTPNDGKTEFFYKSDTEPRLGYSTANQPYDNSIVIPGPNDGQLTFLDHEGNELGVFTADQDGDTTITLPQGFSGDYNDLINAPEINDGKLTFKDENDDEVGEFTANQKDDSEVKVVSKTYIDAGDDSVRDEVSVEINLLREELCYYEFNFNYKLTGDAGNVQPGECAITSEDPIQLEMLRMSTTQLDGSDVDLEEVHVDDILYLEQNLGDWVAYKVLQISDMGPGVVQLRVQYESHGGNNLKAQPPQFYVGRPCLIYEKTQRPDDYDPCSPGGGSEPNDGKLTITDEHGVAVDGEFTANQAGDTVISLPGFHIKDENCEPQDSVVIDDYMFELYRIDTWLDHVDGYGSWDIVAELGEPDEYIGYSDSPGKATYQELIDSNDLELVKRFRKNYEKLVLEEGGRKYSISDICIYNNLTNTNGQSPLVYISCNSWPKPLDPDSNIVILYSYDAFNNDNEITYCQETCYDPCPHDHCEYDSSCGVELEFKAGFDPCAEYGIPKEVEYNDICRKAPEGNTEAEAETRAYENCNGDWWFVVCEAKNDYIGVQGRDYSGNYTNCGDRLTWNPDDLTDPHPMLSKVARPNGYFWEKWRWVLEDEGGRELVGFKGHGYGGDHIPREDLTVINIDDGPAADDYCAPMRHLPEEERKGWREITLPRRVEDGTASNEDEYEFAFEEGTRYYFYITFHKKYWDVFKTLVVGDTVQIDTDQTSDYRGLKVQKEAEPIDQKDFYRIWLYDTYQFKWEPTLGTPLKVKYEGVEEPDHKHFYSFPHNPIDEKVYGRKEDKWVPIDNHLESFISICAYRLEPDRHELHVKIQRKDTDKHHELYRMHWRLNNIHLEGKNASGKEQSLPQWDQFIEPLDSEGPNHWTDDRLLSFKINLKRAADMPAGQKPPVFDEIYLDVEYESQSHRTIDLTAGKYNWYYSVNPATVHPIVSESLGIQVTPFDPENPNYNEA